VGDPRRYLIARDWVKRLPVAEVILPAQVLGELSRVLVGKAGLSSAVDCDRVLEWAGVFPIVPSKAGALMAAFDLATDHQWSIWDALMCAVTAEAGCGTWLSGWCFARMGGLRPAGEPAAAGEAFSRHGCRRGRRDKG